MSTIPGQAMKGAGHPSQVCDGPKTRIGRPLGRGPFSQRAWLARKTFLQGDEKAAAGGNWLYSSVSGTFFGSRGSNSPQMRKYRGSKAAFSFCFISFKGAIPCLSRSPICESA